MTTDEAILKLQELKIASLNENHLNGLSPMHEALDMAIEALEEHKKIEHEWEIGAHDSYL